MALWCQSGIIRLPSPSGEKRFTRDHMIASASPTWFPGPRLNTACARARKCCQRRTARAVLWRRTGRAGRSDLSRPVIRHRGEDERRTVRKGLLLMTECTDSFAGRPEGIAAESGTTCDNSCAGQRWLSGWHCAHACVCVCVCMCVDPRTSDQQYTHASVLEPDGPALISVSMAASIDAATAE